MKANYFPHVAFGILVPDDKLAVLSHFLESCDSFGICGEDVPNCKQLGTDELYVEYRDTVASMAEELGLTLMVSDAERLALIYTGNEYEHVPGDPPGCPPEDSWILGIPLSGFPRDDYVTSALERADGRWYGWVTCVRQSLEEQQLDY